METSKDMPVLIHAWPAYSKDVSDAHAYMQQRLPHASRVSFHNTLGFRAYLAGHGRVIHQEALAAFADTQEGSKTP
eukprot:139472-Pelagomonas_calceolata.AAC.1